MIAGALPLLCAACGDTPVAGVPKLVRTYVLPGSNLKLTRAGIARIPYASLGVRLGRGDQNLTILGGIEGIQLDWISAKREVIATRHGRVVKTIGLPQNLVDTEFLTPDPLGIKNMKPGALYDCVRTIDLEPLNQYGVVVRSRFNYVNTQRVTILDIHYTLDQWRETCAAETLGWTFTNIYWRDAKTGFLWKSEQYFTPALPAMELVVYKRASIAR